MEMVLGFRDFFRTLQDSVSMTAPEVKMEERRPGRRVFYVDVGEMSPERKAKVATYLQRVMGDIGKGRSSDDHKG